MEYSYKPEEVFFCTGKPINKAILKFDLIPFLVINNNPYWKGHTIQTSKKLLKWDTGGVAKWLTSNDIYELNGFELSDPGYEHPRFLFASNVDVVFEADLKQYIKHNHLGIMT